MVASVSPVVTTETTLWVCIQVGLRSPCSGLRVPCCTFEATCPQAPFYHPPASALTTSLSRTLPEVSGLALSPLSARGTACDSEKENSSGSTDAVVSQVHYGTWRIRAQPVWVPRWTQLGQTSTDWTLRVWLFVFCVLLVSHVWTSSLP